MKVMLSENVTRYYEVEMSDELDLEEVIESANFIRQQCDSANEALTRVLNQYYKRNGNAFDFDVKTCDAWDRVESPIDLAYGE